MGSFSVLMYHGIHDDESSVGNFDNVYSVSGAAYGEHLDYLKDNDWTTRLLVDVNDESDAAKKVVLTFDDGDASNASPAVGPLMERSMVAEFYVTSDRIDQPGSLAASQIREMVEQGMSIQSHGKTHRYLDDLDELAVVEELSRSKARLEDITGREVHTLALPGGRGNALVLRTAKRLGYQFVCTSKLGINDLSTDRFDIRRIAVTRDMTLNTYTSLLRGRGLPYLKRSGRQKALDLLKKVLGNERYEKFRDRWI